MTDSVLVLGNNSSDTDQQTTDLALSNDSINHGLIDNENHVIEQGYYHTSLADLAFGQVLNLAKKFCTIILLDQPSEEWSSSKIFLSTYKLMLELDQQSSVLGIKTEFKNNNNIKVLKYWMDLFKTNKSICVYPWVTFNDDEYNNNYLRTCSRDKSYVTKVSTLQNWKTDPKFIEIRQKMKQGKKLPEHCSVCYEYEQFGSTGYRTHDSLDWISELGLKNINDLDNIENPFYYELRLSNKCNLMCRMCKPSNSHLIKREFKKHPELYSHGQHNADDYSYSSVKVIDISSLTKKHQVYLTGGEPTIMREVYDFMQQCVDQNKTDFKLTFTTNAEKFSDKFLNLAQHFKHLHFSISIDGYGLVNDYIRFRSNFANIINNCHTLLKNGHGITWNHVPTIWGIHKTHLMFEYLSENFPMVPLYLQWNRLDLTSAFSSPLIEETLESLSRTKKTVLYRCDGKDCTSGIDALYEHYKTATVDLEQLSRFFKWNDAMDLARNIRMADYIPDLDACRKLLKNG